MLTYTERYERHLGHLVATVTPPNTRPYRRASEGDPSEVVHTEADKVTVYRQIGWHGQTGAFYALDEDPSKHEPGSFMPMWICVDSELLPDPVEQ